MRPFLLIATAFMLAVVSATTANVSNSLVERFNRNRVIQGDPSDVFESAPYVVSIGVNGHQCSGAIMGSRWILTAAQCVIGYALKHLQKVVVACAGILPSLQGFVECSP